MLCAHCKEHDFGLADRLEMESAPSTCPNCGVEVRLNPWLPAIILGFLSPFLAIGLFLLYSGPESLIYIGVPAIVIYTVLFPALSGLRYRKPKTKTPKEKP